VRDIVWGSIKQKGTKVDRMLRVLSGVVLGVYLDQTHKMPHIETWVKRGIRIIQEWEEKTRK